MLKPFGKKTNTAKRALRVLAIPLAACALMFGATSASADQTVPFSNHTVQTVNPTGTTVNLFDYWVVNGDNDKSVNINNNNGNNNTGINKDHQLKFNGGAGSGINKWTGKSAIGGFGRLSFVKNTLVNGYPSINAGTYTSYNPSGTYTDESLAYLFNNDSQANGKQDGKAVYNNVKGLFQLKHGYYVYDSYGSNGNYAVYNLTTNSFDVYDKAGVYKDSVSDANRGQFFPFDSADKVFEEKNGQLTPKGITDGTNNTLNHHFGTATQYPDHSANRQLGVEGRSVNFLRLMSNELKKHGGVIMTDTRAQKFILDKKGNVIGVKARLADGAYVNFSEKATILASGGYGANRSMLPKKVAQGLFYGLDSDSGDGLKMGREIGARTINLDLVKQYPQGVETTPHHGLAATASSTDTMKKSGAIYVNSDGRRIVDELQGLGTLTDVTKVCRW